MLLFNFFTSENLIEVQKVRFISLSLTNNDGSFNGILSFFVSFMEECILSFVFI